MKVDDATMVTCQWRYALIQPALAAPKRSPERAAIVKDIAGREHVTPKGRRERVGERTLQRWIDAFAFGRACGHPQATGVGRG